MNTTESLQHLEELTDQYLHTLEQYSEEQLRLQPDEDSWSLGQMIVHLTNTALRMQLGSAEKCRVLSEEASTAATAEAKTAAGEAIFELGGFPPERIRVPASAQYTPAQMESKRQLAEGLQEVLRRARELEPVIATLPPEVMVAHPRLGGMNAKEWFLLVEMHYRHHLLQKERLQSFIAGRV